MFKDAAGEIAGMEVLYARYDDEQRAFLKALADGAAGEGYTFKYSAASDYHGQADSDSLDEVGEALKAGSMLDELDEAGKRTVKAVIAAEYARCKNISTSELVSALSEIINK
jgi:hypothetical protein